MRYLLLPVFCAAYSLATAAWQPDPNICNPVCVASNYQTFPAMTTDQNEGVIVAWNDARNGGNNLYAQRLSRQGNVAWTTDGVRLCNVGGSGDMPRITTDGSGGAIVVWADYRNGVLDSDIYVQRVSSAGVPMWDFAGVAISTGTTTQRYPQIASDGQGGAVIVWEDHRNVIYDIYAQRVNSAGQLLWGDGGLAVCNEGGHQGSPQIDAETSGVFHICWSDNRTAQGDLFAQKLNLAGQNQWTPNGVQITTGPAGEGYPVMTSDKQGGFVVAWFDTRPSSQYDVYAQRVNGNGNMLWNPTGVAIATTSQTEQGVVICGDGASGAIIGWYTFPGGASAEDIYVQRVNSSGIVQWQVNGVPVCTAASRQEAPMIVADTIGGAYMTWLDSRLGGSNDNVYLQRIGEDGVCSWQTNGVPVCTAAGNQYVWGMAPDFRGGVILAWDDYRAGASADIYASYVGRSGGIGVFTAAGDWQLLE